MRIIIEGCDGLGKTYLCDRICKNFGVGYYHPPRPPKRNIKKLRQFEKKISNTYEDAFRLENTVFDRSWFTEFAYNYNRKIDYIERFEFLDEEYILILLYFEGNFKKQKFNKKIIVDDYWAETIENKMEKVNQRYIDAWIDSKARYKLKLNWTEFGYEKSQKMAMKFIGDVLGETTKTFQ